LVKISLVNSEIIGPKGTLKEEDDRRK